MPSKAQPLLPAQPSVWQVTRLVKRQDNSLFNCVNSILDDAAFVREIALYYPTLPLLANLRCGLWYTPKPDGTCYYKSTDGHHGAWGFSTTRLNWHVAELATQKGGVVIVDATRKGKRFPDSLSKTIPIWAAVINRAVARVRAHDARKRQQRRKYTADTCNGDDEDLLVPVEDTQTSVSAQAACQPSSTQQAHAGDMLSSQQQPPDPQQQQQQSHDALHEIKQQPPPQQQQQQRLHEVEKWLVDCEDAASRRPPPLNPPASPQGPPTPARLQRCPSDLPPPSPVVVLHRRSQSALLSPQPSLQEWLQQEESGLSPVFASRALQRRHTSGSAARHWPVEPFVFGPRSAPCAASGMAEAGVALASSVSVGSAGAVAGSGSAGSLRMRTARCSSAGSDREGHVLEGAAAEPDACGPATPRIGSWVNSSSGLESTLVEDLQHPFALAQQQQQHHQDKLQVDHQQPSGPSNCSCGRQGSAESCQSRQLQSPASFAFPSPDTIAECTAACTPSNASTDGNQSCGGGSTAPASPQLEMPIVVLNGRSHNAAVAASILDIWRAAELEHMCDLPHDIADFVPGIVREACNSPTSPGQQQQQQGQHEHHASSNGVVHDWCCSSSSGHGNGSCCSHPGNDDSEATGSLPDGLSPFQDAGAAAVGEPSDSAQSPPGVGGLSAALRAQQQIKQQWHQHQQMRRQHRQQQEREQQQQQASSVSAQAAAEPWDTELHLPLWISAAEHAQIESRLDGWVERLFEVGADVRSLAAVLTKPLRPLWVSQASTIWVNQVAQPQELPFTPLVLVSASQPQSYTRQACRQEGGEEDGKQQHEWSYVYVSGAGDDEESWSRGLTPTLFWQHHRELIAAGPAGIAAAVAALLAAAKPRALFLATTPSSSRSKRRPPARAGSAAKALTPGVHNLPPKGCEGAAAAAAAAAASATGGGAFWLGSTGVAVGAAQAAAAPGVWRQFDAVLCCGVSLHPGLKQEWEAMQLAAKLAPATCAAAAQWMLCSTGSGWQRDDAVSSNVWQGATLTSAGAACEGCAGVNGHTGSPGGVASCGVGAGLREERLLWLPVQGSKYSRSSLKDGLHRALCFLSAHLAEGRRVLICDDDGEDTCICVAVALLLACYSWPNPTFTQPWLPQHNSSSFHASSSDVHEPSTSTDGRWQQQQCQQPLHQPAAGMVTKQGVRQRLTHVSTACPSARPMRGMLKQVFNFFEEHRRQQQMQAHVQHQQQEQGEHQQHG